MGNIPPGTDLNLIPVAQPPNPSIKANLTGKAELEDVTIATCSVLIALQLLFLGIRFFTKASSKSRFGYDDCMRCSCAALFQTDLHQRVRAIHRYPLVRAFLLHHLQ